MSPQTFIDKWGPKGPAFALNEEQGAQSHFLDLCELLDVPKPGSQDGYVFEKKALVLGEARGYADVFKRGAFAWENKAPGKNLDAALKQLLNYSSALSNPPLLVVCDRLTIRVQSQFTGHPSEKFTVLLDELQQPDKLALLRRIWLDPESFRPKVTSRDITEEAAKSFATLAGQLRKSGHEPQKVSHFLTQCLFCFFAEDVGLLPNRLFEKMINAKLDLPSKSGALPSEKLANGLNSLFHAMNTGDLFGVHDLVWFNGGLFKNIDVPKLDIMNVTELRNAAALNWSAIDVSIFGTLFERGLDPGKRSQLGAHYTDPATIMRIIEPVLQRPLLQIWELVEQEIQGLMAKSKKKDDAQYKKARARFTDWLLQLQNFRVLDPACGSGNFLFLGLKALKDIEHQSHLQAAALGLDREADLVTGPHNMLGIELNEYAAELARLTVWIGELQWRLAKGYEFKTNPVLEPLDNIECRDALLEFVSSPDRPPPLPGEGGGGGSPLPKAIEATWPQASIVIGNPPFVGDKKMRAELGDDYTNALRKVYKGRVPGGADLVCYWFERARTAMETNELGAAGLVATNSIRGGKNRTVLDAICKITRIFEAWSDEGWVNKGAAVNVSLIAFGSSVQLARLDGNVVSRIHTDLRANDQVGNESDIVSASGLRENKGVALQGPTKGGSFDIEGALAAQWIVSSGNPNRKSNADVLKPWFNGDSIAGRWSGKWIIDFAEMSETEACLYEKPFEHVNRLVKPARRKQGMPSRKIFWWRYNASAPKVRSAILKMHRYLVTPEVSKHRIFAWLPLGTAPDKNLVVFLKLDDCFFGVLQSRFHEVWALRKGTSLEDRPRYTSSTTFRTFPFPPGLTPADTASQQTESVQENPLPHVQPKASPSGAGEGASPALIPAGLPEPVRTSAIAIAQAAHRLNALRENWLNPPEWTQRIPEVIPLGMTSSPYPDRIVATAGHEKDLAERTLTKLYNQRPAWLHAAHQALDLAVAAAYGWADYSAEMPDEEILKRLLALNLQRAAAQ